MKNLVFISDFFASKVAGGGEICDHILISLFKADGSKTIRWNSHVVSDKLIRLYRNCGFFFVVSNFCNLDDTAKQ